MRTDRTNHRCDVVLTSTIGNLVGIRRSMMGIRRSMMGIRRSMRGIRIRLSKK